MSRYDDDGREATEEDPLLVMDPDEEDEDDDDDDDDDEDEEQGNNDNDNKEEGQEVSASNNNNKKKKNKKKKNNNNRRRRHRKDIIVYKSANKYIDHFSLESRSDEICFKGSAVRVYGSGTQQFQLVESNNNTIKAKITSDGSSGLTILRAMYTLVSILMMGFLLIFCLQVILFLFVSLVMDSGFTSKQELDWLHLFGTILSVPVFVYGLASSLTMSSEFVHDTYKGHHFFRSILRWNAVFIDWFAFAVFLGIPLLVMIYKMFTSEHWWEVTALTWFGCVLFSYCLFCLAVFIYEIWGALELLSHHPNFDNNHDDILDWFSLLKRAVFIRQLYSYSGVRHRTFYIEGSHTLPSPNDSYDKSKLADHEHVQEKITWYTKLTQILPDNIFYEYDIPKRQFNIEDVLDRTVYVTDTTWNLEKLFCRRKNIRAVVVVNGPSKLTNGQVISSLLCGIIGNILCLLTFIAILVWAGVPIIGIIILLVIVLFFTQDIYKRIYAIYDTYNDTKKRNNNNNIIKKENITTKSQAIYQVTETHRLTRPSEQFCWILFGIEIISLLLIPLYTLFVVGNIAIASLFLILGFFSFFRHYFNAPVVLTELGSLDLLDGKFIRTKKKQEENENKDVIDDLLLEHDDDDDEDWREKNRLSKIISKISQGSRRDTWIGIIFTFVIIFLLLFISAYNNGSNEGDVGESPNLLHDFQYKQQKGFAYPTCSMTEQFQIPGSPDTALADYAYLASMGYVSPKSTPTWLNDWFGEDVAHDEYDLVQQFRTEVIQVHSAVHYKLITFHNKPNFAILTIRGTSNGWDMLSDAQLWSAALLAQIVRWIIPLGEIWNPILENLVNMIAILQAENLKKVAFYVHTTNFVHWLQQSKHMYKDLRITGHSLGGGLAMITGAQTETPAIALSGPNTMISRDTMDPPVTVENLNAYTFNIVPDRDVVPMIDDKAKNYQRISCLADSNNFVDCHTSLRSLCDILYTCGSGSRPVLCDCALYYGYPEPEPIGDRTFKEACMLQ